MHNITIYTDGSCSGNPGPGGWAFLLMNDVDDNMVLTYGSEDDTTNNRMELTAVIAAIRSAKAMYGDCNITIYTDSKYIEGTVNNGWLLKWIKDSFKGKKNVDLWVELYGLLCSSDVKLIWVKGHDVDVYNKLVDYYARNVVGTNTKISESIIKKVKHEKE